MTENWIERELVGSRVTRLAGSFRKAQFVVLAYRSVLDQPERESVSLGSILHSTEIFKRQIELISRDCIPVTLDDVLLFTRGQKELPADAIAVTFDDGYLDDDPVAARTLDRVAMPSTFYMNVDAVETSETPWRSRLRHAFLTTRRKGWNDQHGGTWLLGWNDQHDGTWPLESQQQREEAFLRACDFCAALSGNLQEQFVRAIEAALDVDSSPRDRVGMMNGNDVHALVARGDIVVSDSMRHSNVALVWDGDAAIELPKSQPRREHARVIPIVHFSYASPPVPAPRKKSIVEFSRRVGLGTAVISQQHGA